MGGEVIMEGIPDLHPMTMTTKWGKIGMQWSYMLPAGATATGKYYHLQFAKVLTTAEGASTGHNRSTRHC